MNKPNDPSNTRVPAKDAEQVQKGTNAGSQKPGQKDEPVSQKSTEPQTANKDPKKS